MDVQTCYTPPPGLQELVEDSLVEIEQKDSTELWLIQLPEDTASDIDGRELSLDLHQDGHLGCFEGSSGMVYNMIDYSSQASDATVFVASPSGPQIAGKIKRHVSLAYYPEPSELKARYAAQKQTSHLSTPSQSMSQRHSQSRSRSTHTSSRKSSVFDARDVSKPSKRAVGEMSRFSDQSARSSGPPLSGTTFSGSSEHSHRKKSKRGTQ